MIFFIDPVRIFSMSLLEAKGDLPTFSQISRIPREFFPNRESCLQTKLLDEATSSWIQQQNQSIKALRENLSSSVAGLLERVKEKARGRAEQSIQDYSIKLRINRASLLVFPEQQYLLSYQPQGEKELKWFWKNAIDFNIQTIVAAIMPKEKEPEADHTLEYGVKELYPLKIDEEWTLELKEEVVWVKSETVAGCEIIKRTFRAYSETESRSLYHYHYQGWKNKKGAPDSKLFARLIMECPRGSSPILIHCARGGGRSGTVVLADIFWQRIKAQLKTVSLEEATLNVAEVIFQGRLQRDGFVEKPEQIVSAFETALLCI